MIKIRNIKLYNLSIPLLKDYSNHLEQKKWNDHFLIEITTENGRVFGEVVSFLIKKFVKQP